MVQLKFFLKNFPYIFCTSCIFTKLLSINISAKYGDLIFSDGLLIITAFLI